MMRRFQLLLYLAVVLPASLAAQLSAFGGPIARSDMAYMAGDPALSYSILETHLAVDSMDYEGLWRAARAAVVIGIEQEESLDQNHWLDPAIRLSERAVTVRPAGIDGIYWRGVSAGQRAMNASPSYAVGLAESVYRDAHAILTADPLHGGAHNMLGKLNYEVMSLSWFERTIARTFMGNDALDDTSWDNAEHHLLRATTTWPDFVLFHFDLGELRSGCKYHQTTCAHVDSLQYSRSLKQSKNLLGTLLRTKAMWQYPQSYIVHRKDIYACKGACPTLKIAALIP